MSRWAIEGPWGVVHAYHQENGMFAWKAVSTKNRTLMRDILEISREEYSADGRWLGVGLYTPDLLEEAVKRVVAEFGGDYKLLEANPPAPPETIF